MYMVRLERQHAGQKGSITYMRKNGNQQNTNTPIIIPSVRAALRSLDKEIRCFSSINWWTNKDFFAGLPDLFMKDVSRCWDDSSMFGNFPSSAANFSAPPLSLLNASGPTSLPSDDVPLPGDMLGTSDNDSSVWAFGTSNDWCEHFANLCLQRFLLFLHLVFPLQKI